MRMRTGSTAAVLALLAGGLVLHACGDGGGPTEPRAEPGFLAVRIATPAVGTAGALLELSGSGIDSVRAVPGFRVFEPGQGNPRRVIAAGSLRAGIVLEFWVPDTRELDSYDVEFLEVVVPETFESHPLDGFRADLIVR